MRIAEIMGDFYPKIGGANIHVRLLKEELLKRGHDITILSPISKRTFLRSKGNVLYFKSFFLGVSIPFIIFLLRNKYDILHVHGYRSFDPFIVGLLKPFHKTPIIFTPHYHPFGKRPKLIRKLFDLFFGKLSFKFADKIIIISPIEKKLLNKYKISNDKFIMIPDPISSNFFNKNKTNKKIIKETKTKWGLKSKVILFVGRIAFNKGLDTLIKSFALLKKQMKDVSLLIVGDGDQKIKIDLNNLIKELKVKDIIFKGRVSDKNLIVAYDLSNVFVLYSSYESFGMVFAEAMSRGVPCIGTDRGGIPFVLEFGKSGLIIPYGNSKKLYFSLYNLLNNNKLRNKIINNAKKYVLQFNVKNQIDKLESLFKYDLEDKR